MTPQISFAHGAGRRLSRASVAALELVLLLGAGSLLLAKPVVARDQAPRRGRGAIVARAAPKKLQQAIRKMNAPAGKARPRSTSGSWCSTATASPGRPPARPGRCTGSATRSRAPRTPGHQNYASSVVMYRPGYRAEGIRLAHDLAIKVVGPLDGIKEGTRRRRARRHHRLLSGSARLSSSSTRRARVHELQQAAGRATSSDPGGSRVVNRLIAVYAACGQLSARHSRTSAELVPGERV